jgi:hypothetical protein
VQSCNTGKLTLDTFIEGEGKIIGFRLGNHRIEQIEKTERASDRPSQVPEEQIANSNRPAIIALPRMTDLK